ncbi:hypothetical protein E1B28_004663 [Marasmius oreades]|uniref:N-acetyltransferase domain-containing protein n=1 Tax=Marasmius oreades TaxID=181124 RepID=A0A9P7UZ19_9AGAR|nr:uncharacterized protein E1B28_004663 [Marasmius oreades]KAG7097300.1 hypothetical protein E1B28_004663 [Marasmius oreades]
MTTVDVPEHEIVIATTEEEIQQCYQVRIDVFHHEQHFPLDVEIDHYDSDPSVKHFLLRLTHSLASIGVIRGTKFLKDNDKYYTYKLSRLAVLKPYRQYKLGSELVHALHDWVRTDAKAAAVAAIDHQGQGQGTSPPPLYVRVIAHSQIPVKGFYEK